MPQSAESFHRFSTVTEPRLSHTRTTRPALDSHANRPCLARAPPRFAQRMAELEAAATEPAPTVVFRRLSADSPAATAAEPTAAETAAEPTSTRPASANIIRFAGTPAADSEEAV